MTTEEIVRRVLTDDHHALSPWPDPVGRVRAGIRRRRRRRLGAAVVACSVVAVLVAVSVAVSGPPVAGPPRPPAESADAVIPWVDRPATRPTSFARLEPGPQPDRPCEDADLSKGWVEAVRPSSGPWVQTVVVRNQSETACALSGSAQVRGQTLSGARITMAAASSGPVPMEGADYPARLRSMALARVDVTMTCPSDTRAPAPELTEPSIVAAGIEIEVEALSVRPDCTLAIGNWYSLRPLLNAPLFVTIEAPEQVRRGQTLTYEVVVINTLDRPLGLDPCPVYQQRLGDRAEWYRLNCVLPRLPDHQPIRFQMRMRVPADAPVEQVRLSWMAVTGDGRVATANMDTGGVPVAITD